MTTWESEAVATRAADLPASVVSMRSAAPSLSNKNMYPTFLRTDQSATTYARVNRKVYCWKAFIVVGGGNL